MWVSFLDLVPEQASGLGDVQFVLAEVELGGHAVQNEVQQGGQGDRQHEQVQVRDRGKHAHPVTSWSHSTAHHTPQSTQKNTSLKIYVLSFFRESRIVPPKRNFQSAKLPFPEPK